MKDEFNRLLEAFKEGFNGEEKNIHLYKEKIKPLELAFAKLSVLDSFSPGYEKISSTFDVLFKNYTLEDCLKFCKEFETDVKAILSGKCFQFKPTSYGSVEWFIFQNPLSLID